MRYRKLGSSGLDVSVLSLGTMGFGPRRKWFGGADQKEADRMVRRCLDAGVNLFDSADVYSDGLAERMLGKALGKRRGEALVATKVWGRMAPGANGAGLSRKRVIEACEASLARLGTDVIDLYQLHSWDAGTPLEETLSALERLVRDGKVRYVGVSNFRSWQMTRALWIAERRGFEPVRTNQVGYNLVERGIEGELAPMLETLGGSVLAYSPLAGGYLTGKYTGKKGSGRLADEKTAYPRIDRAAADRVVAVLRKMEKASGASCAQIALAWTLSRPWVCSTIFGGTSDKGVAANLGAADLELPPSAVEALDRAAGLDV